MLQELKRQIMKLEKSDNETEKSDNETEKSIMKRLTIKRKGGNEMD